MAENAHTIQYTDGTPFLWIGDTGWGLFQQLTREEVDQYLDNRQKLGFTGYSVWSAGQLEKA